jgi:hypothetical protein
MNALEKKPLKIFIYEPYNYCNNAPSKRIFFCEQLCLCIKNNYFQRVRDINKAEIIFASSDSSEEIRGNAKYQSVPVVLYKPHLEVDTFLKGKNIYGTLRAAYNRFKYLILRYPFIPYAEENWFYIADSRRLMRSFESEGVKSFWLKLIPYPVFNLENNIESDAALDRSTLHLGCIGEATVHYNILSQLDFTYWKERGYQVTLFLSLYGPTKDRLIRNLLSKVNVVNVAWPEQQKELSSLFKSVDVFIVPHGYVESETRSPLSNLISPSTYQPNNYGFFSKYSCNSGRNYLASGLNKIFVTQPIEDVLVDFPQYPEELFFEKNSEINTAIESALNPNTKINALLVIDKFRQKEYVSFNNLNNFVTWCKEITHEV